MTQPKRAGRKRSQTEIGLEQNAGMEALHRELWPHLDREERALYPGRWTGKARTEQLPPGGEWRQWLVCAGRGFGKTRTGAEWVVEIARLDGTARIALVAASLVEARSIMVEGESGILACALPKKRPQFEPSLRRLSWPNGALAFLYSAAEPESLRGPQHSHARRAGTEGIHRQRGACPDRRAAPSRYRGHFRYRARIARRGRMLACR